MTDSFQHKRISILTDGYSTPFFAKTAMSLLRYRTNDISAVVDKAAAGSTTQDLFGAGGSIPVVKSLADILDSDAMYLGISPAGGEFPGEWRPTILEALRRKMDVVSGLHDFLNDDAEFTKVAAETGARLVDVRRNFHKTTAKAHMFRPGNLRIHAVGHDCSVGKMVSTLEIQRGLAAAGHDAKFLATGQTGIMIAGEGVPIDCVVADFINGAAEELVKQNEQHDFLLIEGQGSIAHPSFSAVTLGLLHGCAPHGLIFCYEAGRQQVKGLDNIDIRPVADQMRAYGAVANLRHPCRIIGLAINTRNLTEDEAAAEISQAEDTFGLPACDVYRTGTDKLVTASVDLHREVFAE